ncbi:cyclic pyranopterin monophosphate synthase subunit MoaA [Geothermobacter ehrlichii]|uniref:GTP 3',8-cyclase n=1 Tax=Geothermobacter ehrlichii TaxID=213224 RepID=A0A5D3WGL3_9BACT|nr:GTP 3',8-cyclase MoaA [Geothermobacter ehrlichii]TYO96664.1 cyclic pyranopterin monophosphate synthase subunit MoaA [Geothermobacter ehrlichii]
MTEDPTPVSLADRFGRHLDYLRLSITDRCNLRCRYCMPEEGVASLGHDAVLRYEELLRIARVACGLGVRKIRVTGGEPLVRKGVVGFIRDLAALPQKPEITLTTNGLRLAELAEELGTAGMSRVNVSLDTLRADRFRDITRRDGLERVLAGIAAADRAGLGPVKINMVPIAGVNEDEIEEFARLTLAHPWNVRFIEFMPVSGDLEYAPERRVPVERIMAALERVAPLVEEPRTGPAGPARLYRYAGAPGGLGVIPAVSSHFCGECNRLRVTSDGRIRPCLFSGEEIDLRAAIRAGASDEELAAIFRRAAHVKPDRHHLEDSSVGTGQRRMGQIGG